MSKKPRASRNPDATRANLLRAARGEFAARGIAGARVDRIAEKAGVNKERIYGHFGSKEKLFEAVVIDALEEHTAALGLPTGDPADYLRRVYDFHRANPDLLRLLMWEGLHYGTEALPGGARRRALYVEKVKAFASTLGATPDDKTAVTLLALIGMAVWPHAVPRMTSMIMDRPIDEETHATIREHLAALITKIVE